MRRGPHGLDAKLGTHLQGMHRVESRWSAVDHECIEATVAAVPASNPTKALRMPARAGRIKADCLNALLYNEANPA